ncbi:MAG: aldo/keto reductase [Anaerovoracaceae bacterium]|jgi:predicted aldo/keto reductase-like oxidoreductase
MDIFPMDHKLGFGMMRLPELPEGAPANDYANVDLERVKAMVDRFLARGFRYFDTATMYHHNRSEQVVRAVLTSRYPRDAYDLADKFHITYLKGEDHFEGIFARQLEACGVDSFDYYLLHDIANDNLDRFEENGIFAAALREKERGRIRHFGFSSHDHGDFVERLLHLHPELEFVQLQLNYTDWDSPGVDARGTCAAAVRCGRPIVVMEPVKGGLLADVPPAAKAIFRRLAPRRSDASWALRFAAGQENVALVLSGMSSEEQLRDNMDCMTDFRPLDKAEQEAVREAAAVIAQDIEIPCTGCSYCVDGCPAGIPIPRYFSLYNGWKKAADPDWSPESAYYQRLTARQPKPEDCLGCRRCEEICPQHLPIVELLGRMGEMT